MQNENNRVRSTTVLLVRKDAQVALAGDGQVTMGETVMKASAKKVRRLYNDQILAGFAGATGDAFSLLTRFESKLEQYHGNLERAAIELSKEWRTDKIITHVGVSLECGSLAPLFGLTFRRTGQSGAKGTAFQGGA